MAFKPSTALLESRKTIGFLLEDMNFDREEARQRCNLKTDKYMLLYFSMPRVIYNYSGSWLSLIYGILLAMELLSKISLLDVSLFFFFSALHGKKKFGLKKR